MCLLNFVLHWNMCYCHIKDNVLLVNSFLYKPQFLIWFKSQRLYFLNIKLKSVHRCITCNRYSEKCNIWPGLVVFHHGACVCLLFLYICNCAYTFVGILCDFRKRARVYKYTGVILHRWWKLLSTNVFGSLMELL